MLIVRDKISLEEIIKLEKELYGDVTKAVVDIEKEIIAINGEMHADEEALLLDEGSQQNNLWGININISSPNEYNIEFDSIINIRPRLDNRSRYVENPELRNKIIEILKKLIL